MSELQSAVETAVERAIEAYENEPQNALDHGFAHVELDGRTRLARALQAHEQVDATDSSYVTIQGVSRYLTPQRKAYREFVRVLDEHEIDVEHVSVYGRLD
jgi:hypothetical protein